MLGVVFVKSKKILLCDSGPWDLSIIYISYQWKLFRLLCFMVGKILKKKNKKIQNDFRLHFPFLLNSLYSKVTSFG